MSAWLLWARIGLYPLAGSDQFILGSPRFGDVRVRMLGSGNDLGNDGTVLRVLAHNASHERRYILRAESNGEMLHTPIVRFHQLVREGGALLEVWMGSDPAQSAWRGTVLS